MQTALSVAAAAVVAVSLAQAAALILRHATSAQERVIVLPDSCDALRIDRSGGKTSLIVPPGCP
jgi:hypothetical protein